MYADARLLDGGDRLRVESTASFTTLGEAQAARLTGVEVDDANRTFLGGT